MDSNDLLNIQEAYMGVYINNQEDELTEDFELWVESLIDEGYDLSDYTWNDMYGFYLDEAAVNWDTGKTKSGASPRKKTENKFVQYGFSTNPRDQKRAEQLALVHQNMTDAIKKTGKRRVGKAGPIASARFRNAAIRQRGGKQPSVPIRTVPGLKDANNEVKKEQLDLYDLVLSHLLDEGYASTEEAATAIMANMTEEWVDAIVEDYRQLPRRKMLNKANRLRKSRDTNKRARSADIEYQLRAHSPESSKTLSYLNKEYGRGVSA